MKNFPEVRIQEAHYDERGYIVRDQDTKTRLSMPGIISAFWMQHHERNQRSVEFVSVNDYFVYMVAYLPNGKKYSTLVVTDEANHDKVNLEVWDRYQ